jgi:formylmethanofuran dehydrogenase subunit E
MRRPAILRLSAALLFAVACGGSRPPPPPSVAADAVSAKLEEVARIHGGAGPWAVAGYRMGESALRTLGVERGSFDLEVIHYTPHEVQYSCIADGAAAATGASLGKLNLSLADAPAPETHTVYRRKSTGSSVTLRVTRAFAARFADVPREKLRAAGREVLGLRDEDIFETVQ